MTVNGKKVITRVHFPIGAPTTPGGGPPPPARPLVIPAELRPSGDEQCARHHLDLANLIAKADKYGKVDDNPDLHYRAARIVDLDQKVRVGQRALTMLEDIRADPARTAQFGDPVLMDGRIQMQRKLVEAARAKVEDERAESARLGFSQLTEPDGADSVIMALFWRHIAEGARAHLRACDDPRSPLRDDVEPFIGGVGIVLADLEGGHGVGTRSIVEQLLEEDKR